MPDVRSEMGRIVVGVDGSASAARALQWAVREGKARGWFVTAVLAWDLLGQHHATSGERFEPSYGEAQARAALDSYVEAALGQTATGALDERKVVCDLPAPALLDASATADLLVVGARGMGGFRGLLIGSVSQKCLHHARCPVVVVHAEDGDELGEIGRVVVGVDDSVGASRALDWALDEARAHQAMVEVVHAWGLPSFGADEAGEAAGRRIVDEVLGAADLSGLSGPITRTLVNGTGAAAILRAAEAADLVVLGSRGRGGFKGLLLGSVSDQVAHHARWPVLIVPTVRDADAARSG
jgi:nucleotide-binding universal stress UspA family protein